MSTSFDGTHEQTFKVDVYSDFKVSTLTIGFFMNIATNWTCRITSTIKLEYNM